MTADAVEASAEALWYVGPGRAEIRSEPLGAPGPGEVRVRALYSAISRGTERLVFAGRVPATEYRRMRAPFMAGAFPFPVKYGYATVGRVERGPAELENRTVFALHPHQTLFDLPTEAVLPIPDGLPPARAVLAANMETALNAIWDAAPSAADHIAVVGAGVVGSLVAWLCGRIPGARVTLVDVEPSRAGLARALGVGFAAPGEASPDRDLVVHASGTAGGLTTALALAGDVAIPLGGAFHSRRLKLISSQVGQVSPSHRARWTHRRRLAAALDMLTDSRLDALMAPAVGFFELPMRLPEILAGETGPLCQPVAYPGT
jgi:threonine dehydrogenase-like Zn-dependent dehydrogenase